MILVVGASGLLGSGICRDLRARGADVRALVRAGSSGRDELASLGVSLATGDLKDPASLRIACEGVETVVTTANAMGRRGSGDSLATVDRDGQLALLEAARAASVRRFVYVSVSPNLPASGELVRIKRHVEREVRGSGLEWVILQPPAFQEIWISPLVGWDLPRGRARLFGRGDRPVSYVAVGDVARVAGEAALRSNLARRELAFGGPEAVSPNALVRLAEEIGGRPFRVRHVPVAPLKLVRAALSPFAPVPASILALAIDMAERGDVLEASALWRELGMQPTPVREYLEAALAAR